MKMHDQPVSMESAVNFDPRVLSISAACFSQGGAACFSMGRGEHPWFQPPPGKNTLYGIDITEVSECKLIYQKYWFSSK